ncbi:MAG: type II secretion system F family protein [Elusimicrobiaceae bacterium]|nr:type II secretion system F family protein [Elusimicrobiaceae bacterium]
MMLYAILLILVLLGAFCTFLVVFRLLAPEEKKEEVMDVAVKRYKSTSSFSRLQPEEKFFDRLALFCLQNFHVADALEEMHLQLGSPDTPQPVDILYSKILCALVIPAAMMLLFQSLWPVVFVPLCFYVPDVLIKSKIQKRQAEILGNFSTTVDLAALIIESGLDYLTAFERIIKIAKEKTILEEELEKTINEIKLGYSRREALEHFAARTGVQEVRSLVGLIIQSDELGTSLVDLLRNFSSDLRSRRLSRAEKLAAQASTKMLFPLFVFIFPTIFILILAPMIMGLINGGIGF